MGQASILSGNGANDQMWNQQVHNVAGLRDRAEIDPSDFGECFSASI